MNVTLDPHDLGWRGNPADLVAATEPDHQAFLRHVATLVPEWHREAACAGADIALFFPTRGDPSRPALELCASCVVRRPCLAEALGDPTLDIGIRGGMTAPARRAARLARTTTVSVYHEQHAPDPNPPSSPHPIGTTATSRQDNERAESQYVRSSDIEHVDDVHQGTTTTDEPTDGRPTTRTFEST